MIHDFPYTDMHELNLDWFLAEFKKYYEKTIQQDEKIQSLDETVQQFTSFVTNYFDNLDVQQEINHKLDEMAADGTLSALIQPLFDTYKTAIDAEVQTQNGKINVLEGRMDAFSSLTEGSTTGDAELMDIRVAADGQTYPTAGDAVRGQVDQLSDAIISVQDYSFEVGDDMLPVTGITGYKITASGAAADASKTLKVYALDHPVYVNTQDGYQFRSGTGAATTIKTILSSYTGWIYPVEGSHYLAVSNDISATTYYVKSAREKKDPDIKYNTDRFEVTPESVQIFDSEHPIIVKNTYVKADRTVVTEPGALVISCKIDGSASDVFNFKIFDGSIYDVSRVLSANVSVSDDIPYNGYTVAEIGSMNAELMRGFVNLSASAVYLNIMIRFNSEANMNAYLDNIVNSLVIKKGAFNGDYPVKYIKYRLDIEDSLKANHWRYKKIWWCGTSIPDGVGVDGKSYPDIVAENLGATVYNESLSSSMARANVRTGDYVDALSYNLIYSLSQTAEEKQYLIDNWATIKSVLKDPTTFNDLTAVAADVIASSFETKLTPYLDGTKPMPDLFIFDHGHNDWKNYYTMPDGTTPDIGLIPSIANISDNTLAEDTYMTDNNYDKLISIFGEIAKIPAANKNAFIASVNRNCFIGAINFLCTYILSVNPRARIIFIGNLDNWQKAGLQDAQKYIADQWEFPLIPMWEFTGFSWHFIPNSYDFYGGSGDDLRMKNIYCKDGTHPHTDTTGETLPLYADIISEHLKLLR